MTILQSRSIQVYISSLCSERIFHYKWNIHYTTWMPGIFTRDSCIQC
nr:MAG TPA: hypothetical protein [Caudoviricetes sp.]